MKRAQRGVTFIGVVVIGAIVAMLAIVAAQLVPTLIEYQAIGKAAHRAAAGTTVAEVRSLFDKAALIDDIHSVRGADLQITKENDRVVVNFAYEREIHLAGPAWLVMRYSGSSK
jgi:Tfp pilus assembly protein PilE